MGFVEIVLLIGIIPLDLPVSDSVDLIETNHFYDEQCRHVFDQAIFWDFNKGTCKYEVREWRLLKSPEVHPSKNGMTWVDGQCIRKVRAKHVFESWTQFDRELENRHELPKELRRNLSPCWKQVRRVLEER
jgi:hypothetical protein